LLCKKTLANFENFVEIGVRDNKTCAIRGKKNATFAKLFFQRNF